MRKERIKNLRKQQEIYQDNLNNLEIRAAKAGMNVSTEVMNEIEEYRAKLREIKQKITLLELESVDFGGLSEEEKRVYEKMMSRAKSNGEASEE